jgi:hypothetical protein
MLNMAIRGESDKQTCCATEILRSAVTITTPSLGALSKLLLMPADIPEFIEDLPDVLTLAKKNKHEASGGSEASRV